MDFDSAHRLFLEHHLAERSGERRDRLQRGHREAERLFCRNVWWPLRQNFDRLHPEYEVTDWRGLAYFCDFAWITPYVKLIIEIKGFGPHVQDMDRRKFCRELNRETFLTAMGFQVVSFAYDDVSQRPELCITLLRMLLGRYTSSESPVCVKSGLLAERETIRLACTLARPLRPIDIKTHFQIDHRTAIKILQSLCEKGALNAVYANPKTDKPRYIVRYELRGEALNWL
ncbi:DUF559 domain-containing protein [Saccharibacillus alkalitolerans]|uniref:DUF559 domain-containing protein n=1 Tax=Saccharibacillus alkalitolerans TaxID=2705290 RepID=A0ABX0F3J3_9BACL|nr:DUF559 domain-containing protein [Saccharibacillus alkalitolerans]NGZ75050.1 DUF559 domain-containing protein [Saccharibacillus alkalitolerans]